MGFEGSIFEGSIFEEVPACLLELAHLPLQIPDDYVRSNAMATRSDANAAETAIGGANGDAEECERDGKQPQSVIQTDAGDNVGNDGDLITLHIDMKGDKNSISIWDEAKDCGCEQESFDIDSNDAYGVELQGVSIREYENVLQDI